MINEKDAGKANGCRNDNDIFPAFPAPRVENLGWQGDALSGSIHAASTIDFMPAISQIGIAIIRPQERR